MRGVRLVAAGGRVAGRPGGGRARRGAAVASVALLASASACGPDDEAVRARDPRPNVLLVSIDTVRADHLSVYGYARPTARRLEALAAEGALFEAAYAPSATTGPSHASLFTALPPMAHGVRKNGHVLGAEQTTLAERLAALGFEAGGVVSSYVLSDRFGYGQGFAHFDADFSGAETPEGTTVWEGETLEGRFYGSAGDTTDRALTWLRAREAPERPFFLFVHYFDPHDPYLPPPGYAPPFAPGPKEQLKLNREIFLYDVLLAYVDREIGRLLDGLEREALADRTLVIVTGDHGEGLMTRGHMFHGVHIYEEGVRVPLIVRWPGRVPAGSRHAGAVSLVGIAPTVLALLGEGDGSVETEAGGSGLADALLAGGGEAPAPVFLYRRHYSGEEEVAEGIVALGEKFGVREGRWKLIEGPDEATLELFDLVADPGERVDRAAEEPGVTERLRGLIADWRARYERGEGPPDPVSEAERARLRALGYVE